jgi:hypothetical protein
MGFEYPVNCWSDARSRPLATADFLNGIMLFGANTRARARTLASAASADALN